MRIQERVQRALYGRQRARRKLLARLPRQAVGAEIGVWKGEFTRERLAHAQPRELHLIDPWAFQDSFPDRMYGGTVAGTQDDMDRIFAAVRDEFGDIEGVTIHRAFSVGAMAELLDGQLDWVYIDGNHEFEFVMKDLEAAFEKVKPGGVVAGDDYYWEKRRGYPVRRAVREFVEQRGLEAQLQVYGSQFAIQR